MKGEYLTLETTKHIASLEKENKELKQTLDLITNIINNMMYRGYSIGNTYYMQTGEDSEFGIRGQAIIKIIKEEREKYFK